MEKHARRLQMIASQRLKQYKGKWIPAKETVNLIRIHENYKTKIPAIRYKDMYVGVTSLSFCKWEKATVKNHEETPYTETGRDINFQRTKKRKIRARLDDMYDDHAAEIILHSSWAKHLNFEYYMNRAYVLNRDKLKCRVCGKWLISGAVYTHHINPSLPQEKVNKVNNLASMHKGCCEAIMTSNADITQFDGKTRRKKSHYSGKNWFIHVPKQLYRWSAVCGESRTHGAKRGKICSDCHDESYGKSGGLPIAIRTARRLR
jgi:hypothetical protein